MVVLFRSLTISDRFSSPGPSTGLAECYVLHALQDAGIPASHFGVVPLLEERYSHGVSGDPWQVSYFSNLACDLPLSDVLSRGF